MKQNQEFIQDTFTYLRRPLSTSLSSVKVLALDDFSDIHGGQQRLNTLCFFIMHGGRKSNFYLVNPRPVVFREAYARGAYAIPLKFGCPRKIIYPLSSI